MTARGYSGSGSAGKARPPQRMPSAAKRAPASNPYEAHATCCECGLLQTGPMSAMAALDKVAEKHTKNHGHATTAGMRWKEVTYEPTQP